MKTPGRIHRQPSISRVLDRLVEIRRQIEELPPLSWPEKAKLENSIAIDQLYYSSKLEGTTLTERMIGRAIYGEELSKA